jgi:hypothetical protein
MCLLDLQDAGMGEMVVVTVAYHYYVNYGYVG